MRSPSEWTSLILCDLRRDQSSVEQHEILKANIILIQSDARNHERLEADRDYANQIKSITDDRDRLRIAIDNVYEAASEAKTMAIQF